MKDKHISISMSHKFKEQLTMTAHTYGLSVPEYIRALLFEGFKSPHHHHFDYIRTIEGRALVKVHVDEKQLAYLRYLYRTQGSLSPLVRKLICGRSV